MIRQTNTLQHKKVYYRLVALWVISEAFAGGIMHGLQFPFSGMIVSGLAVMCIVLIAWHVPAKGAIIRATIIVAIFKLMLSPHSPPTAYIAVFFQGLMGELLFSGKRLFTLSAILLAILSLVESAIQRILVLVIVYGSGFWKAVDIFIQKITHKNTISSYSSLYAICYILVHAVAGIFVGIYAARLAQRSAGWQVKHADFIIPDISSATEAEPGKNKKRKKIKIVVAMIWLFMLVLLIQAYFNPAHALFAPQDITFFIVRAVLIILAWYLFFAPIFMILFKKVMARQQLKKGQEVNAVLQLIPQTKYIFISAWQISARESGFARAKLFLKILLINVLSDENPTPVSENKL